MPRNRIRPLPPCLRVFLVGSLLLTLTALPGAVLAKSRVTPSFSAYSGYYEFAGPEGLDNESVNGLRLGCKIKGKDIAHSLDIELVGARIATRDTVTDDEVDVNVLRLDVLYPLYFSEKFLPYLAIGAGGLFTERPAEEESDLLLSYGFGIELPLIDALNLRLEGRHHVIGGHNHHNNFEYTAGLSYHFGQPKKDKPKPPPDSDGDGVPDGRDDCPDTPDDLEIDKRGCPIDPPDADNDSVPDYLDGCGQTPRGLEVDDSGCPFDVDGDGIYNNHDKCPDTPAGLSVTPQGCVDLQSD